MPAGTSVLPPEYRSRMAGAKTAKNATAIRPADKRRHPAAWDRPPSPAPEWHTSLLPLAPHPFPKLSTTNCNVLDWLAARGDGDVLERIGGNGFARGPCAGNGDGDGDCCGDRQTLVWPGPAAGHRHGRTAFVRRLLGGAEGHDYEGGVRRQVTGRAPFPPAERRNAPSPWRLKSNPVIFPI